MIRANTGTSFSSHERRDWLPHVSGWWAGVKCEGFSSIYWSCVGSRFSLQTSSQWCQPTDCQQTKMPFKSFDCPHASQMNLHATEGVIFEWDGGSPNSNDQQKTFPSKLLLIGHVGGWWILALLVSCLEFLLCCCGCPTRVSRGIAGWAISF